MSTVDSCAPRAVRSTQLSTLRPREHAPANLAAAGAMESCAMTLRGCPSLGTRSPVQASVPGELSAAVPQRRVLMRPTLAWDQWQRPVCRRHHRGVVRSPWDTRTRSSFYCVKEVVQHQDARRSPKSPRNPVGVQDINHVRQSSSSLGRSASGKSTSQVPPWTTI